MNKQDPDVTAIVKKLKERALACPWMPMGVPPREHYHKFPNGLTLCFTLDVLPEYRYWHLSLARIPGGVAPEEIEFWPRAFFADRPILEWSTSILSSGKHFYWRVGDRAGVSQSCLNRNNVE